MAKHSSDENKKAILDIWINTGLHGFLIADPTNSIDAASSMAGAAALEIAEGAGYSRKAVTLPASTIRVTGAAPTERIATTVAPEQVWAATADVPTFHKVCYARGATSVRGATTGTLVRVEHALHDSTGAPVAVNLISGQSYRHTATFEVGGAVT